MFRLLSRLILWLTSEPEKNPKRFKRVKRIPRADTICNFCLTQPFTTARFSTVTQEGGFRYTVIHDKETYGTPQCGVCPKFYKLQLLNKLDRLAWNLVHIEWFSIGLRWSWRIARIGGKVTKSDKDYPDWTIAENRFLKVEVNDFFDAITLSIGKRKWHWGR